jgi:hypothetical protein
LKQCKEEPVSASRYSHELDHTATNRDVNVRDNVLAVEDDTRSPVPCVD